MSTADPEIAVVPTTFKPQEFNCTVSFSPYSILSTLRKGEGESSEEFSINLNDDSGDHKFAVLCYPKGGGHNQSRERITDRIDNFFMSEAEKARRNRVGIYLKYIPPTEDSCLDVTFNLTLIGKQDTFHEGNKKFNLAWESGMRFVSSSNGNLGKGLANDFGASMMQQDLLPFFLGISKEKSDETLEIEVNLLVHNVHSFSELLRTNKEKDRNIIPSDIRLPENEKVLDAANSHNEEQVRVGKVIVPVLKSLSQRQRMFNAGCYPGVEFRIMRIFDKNGNTIFGSEPGAEYELKPIYPLVQQLERAWPVKVNEREIPIMLTQSMYNFISAIGSFATAVTGLATAFAISLAISFYFIPSKSMDPNLRIGDVLLVEKLSTRLTGGSSLKKDDVILFPAPSRLQEIIVSNGGKRIDDRDLFVKRIAASKGDLVSVDPSGNVEINGEKAPGNRNMCDMEPLRLIEKYIKPQEGLLIDDESVFVMGDCSDVSIDSRVWGTLEVNKIVGRPLFRVWPPERFGKVPSVLDN